jgi:hypothetical protein
VDKAIDVATVGMPSPARSVLRTRLGKFVLLLVVPALFATGILGIDWSTGRPRFKFNRERAGEVREEVADRAENLRDEWQESAASSEPGLQLTPQGIFGQRDKEPSSQPTVLPKFLPKLPGAEPSEQKGIFAAPSQQKSIFSFDPDSEQDADGKGPLARIRGAVNDRR